MMFSAYDIEYKCLSPQWLKYLGMSFNDRKQYRIINGNPPKKYKD